MQIKATLAQLVEQLTRNEQVVGSNPMGGSFFTFNGKFMKNHQFYRSFIIGFFLLFLLISGVQAQSTSGFDILRQETGARQTAMAGTGVASINDIYALFLNPACISLNSSNYAGITFIDQILDIISGSVVFSKPVMSDYVIAAAINFTNYGTLDRADQSGNITGSFTPADYVFSLSAASNKFKRFKYGFAVKGIYSRIDQYTASALAFDAGCIYSIPAQNMSVGFSIQNTGTSIDGFIDEKETLPSNVRAGLAKTLAHLPLQLNLDFYFPFKKTGQENFYWSLGGEFTVSDNLFLRWGYSSAGKYEQSELQGGKGAGISFGIGLLLKKYRLDYGWRSKGIAGNVNALTLHVTY